MSKDGHSGLCHSRMNQLPGIVVGTVNRLQFNEWRTNGLYVGRLWQLIAIFDKVMKFMD